ncbi:unnamed protein product [Discula destructiva]
MNANQTEEWLETFAESLQRGGVASTDQQTRRHHNQGDLDGANDFFLSSNLGEYTGGSQNTVVDRRPQPAFDQSISPDHAWASDDEAQPSQVRGGMEQGDRRHGHNMLQMRPLQPPVEHHAMRLDAIQPSQAPQLDSIRGGPSRDDQQGNHLVNLAPPQVVNQRPNQPNAPTSRPRYSEEETQIIRDMMQAGSTFREVGQRLGRNPTSIELKWRRMEGRYGDPHAAKKRRRGDGRQQGDN